MAEHGISMSLSHTSDDSSSEQPTPTTHGGGGGGFVGSSSHRRLPPSPAAFQALALPPQKKPRGRPPGSKNKPKPPVVITQDSEQVLKPVVIEVAPGADVVEAVVSFAHRRNVGISVLSGSGTIANVTLRHPYSHAPALTLHGPFTMLSFSGSYISVPFSLSSSSAATLPPPPLAAASSSPSSANANNPVCSSFAISFSGSQGQIFGGVIAGCLVAATTVVVVASVFKKPEIHRVGGEDGGGGGGGAAAAAGDGDGGDDRDNTSGGGGDQGGGSDNTMSAGFSVATPSTMNCHPGDVNVMQWGHTHSSSRTANY